MKVGVIGAAGYTGGELLRLLINHPEVELVFAQSSSNAGVPIATIHEGLYGDTDLVFSTDAPLDAVDVVFLCSGHGFSKKYWQEHQRPAGLKVIDLAQDFRDESEGYVYGLPEFQLNKIKQTQLLANPGCFATAIQLALLPLAMANELHSDINITAVTGSTGAGVKPGATTHFSWRDNNMSVYKAFEHQHLIEIRRTLTTLQPSFDSAIDFIPVRGDFPRGILAMVQVKTNLSEAEIRELFNKAYSDATFTHVLASGLPDLKQAVNTNKAIIGIQKHEDRLLIVSAIDNLLKGASGQAVQNMNIMFGLPEATGLRLKASAF